MKKIRWVIILVVIAGVILGVCNLLFSKCVRLDSVSACSYRYQYFDDNENVCTDIVLIQKEDCAEIVKIIDGLRFSKEIDYESGFTKEYSVEFLQQNGKNTVVLLQYGQHGLLRLYDTLFDCELDADQASKLYAILQKYHRFDRVLLAG